MFARWSIALVVVGASGLASADSKSLSADELYVVKPEGQNDAAVHKPGRIPWCDGKFTLDVWSKDRLMRAIQSGYTPMTGTTWLDGVEHMCQWADDASWQKQATYVVQQVMNGKGVSQDEAVTKLKRWVVLNKEARDNEGKPPTDEERFAFRPEYLKDVLPRVGAQTIRRGDRWPATSSSAG